MSKRVFCCAEYLRQVTFGTGSTVGVPRQAVTNYAHYWTYTNNGNTDGEDNTDSDSINSWTGNLLTAAYLDPNDAMYFDEPTMPVVMYSHRLVATRV
jgi:hypothetical protein